MYRLDLHPRRWSAALAATVCSGLLVACGSASQPSGGDPTGGPALEYAQCMRAHGVSNFPDPSAHGGLVIPNDINPQSPAFSSAQQLCGKLANAAPGQAGSSESRKLELLTVARCMRAHGIANFADPTTSPPPPGAGNVVIGGNGWYLALGAAAERQSPAYKRAAAHCGGSPTA